MTNHNEYTTTAVNHDAASFGSNGMPCGLRHRTLSAIMGSSSSIARTIRAGVTCLALTLALSPVAAATTVAGGALGGLEMARAAANDAVASALVAQTDPGNDRVQNREQAMQNKRIQRATTNAANAQTNATNAATSATATATSTQATSDKSGEATIVAHADQASAQQDQSHGDITQHVMSRIISRAQTLMDRIIHALTVSQSASDKATELQGKAANAAATAQQLADQINTNGSATAQDIKNSNKAAHDAAVYARQAAAQQRKADHFSSWSDRLTNKYSDIRAQETGNQNFWADTVAANQNQNNNNNSNNNNNDVSNFAVLTPGNGFTGPTAQPGAVGDPNAEGYDAKAIARWDVVPYQTFTGDFPIGVVAFHMNGIDRVEFSANGGPWTAVRQMQLNPRTNVWEYTCNIKASMFADGPIEVRAIVWPTTGVPRVLTGPIYVDGPYDTYVPSPNFNKGEYSMVLYANAGGSLNGPVMYVRPSSGNVNQGDGTINNPFTRIVDAIKAITHSPSNEYGTVILTAEGQYDFGPQPNGVDIDPTFADSYVTVKSAAGLNPSNVFVGNGSEDLNPRQARIHWQDVTIDTCSATVKGTIPWFDHVKFYDRMGWSHDGVNVPVDGAYFATDCTAYDELYGFPNAALMRNCQATHISGDVWQNSLLILNCNASDVDGLLLAHHTDLYQMWNAMENLIIYESTASNLNSVQSLFLQPSSGDNPGALTDAAFVDLDFENNRIPNNNQPNSGGPPFTQMQAQFKHIVFKNVVLPNQQFMMRTDMGGAAHFNGTDIKFDSCTLHWASYDNLIVNGNIPLGVALRATVRGPQ